MFLLQKSKVIVSVLTFVLLLSSCRQQKVSGEKLFAIDSLLQNQVVELINHKAKLKKLASIDSIEQDTTYIPLDSTAWMHELEIFGELNAINKPVNKDSYLVEDGLSDTSSNLTVLSIKAKKDLPVIYVKVFYHNNLQNIKKIEALYTENNMLLKTQRLLALEFHDIYNKNVLNSYSIKGGQKMFIGDSVQFSVKGSIIIP